MPVYPGDSTAPTEGHVRGSLIVAEPYRIHLRDLRNGRSGEIYVANLFRHLVTITADPGWSIVWETGFAPRTMHSVYEYRCVSGGGVRVVLLRQRVGEGPSAEEGGAGAAADREEAPGITLWEALQADL